MRRRAVLIGATPATVTLAGCSESPRRASEPTPPYYVEEGDLLVEATVEDGFDESVELQMDCHEEEYTIAPGEEIVRMREEDGETCNVDIVFDGGTQYSTRIADYISLYVPVTKTKRLTRCSWRYRSMSC